MYDRREPILDEWLILQSQDGDRAAFERLARRWQERLWRYAYRLTGDDGAAWDVLQESWLAITRALGGLRDPAGFRAWAYTIVHRQAVNHRRRRDPAGPDSPAVDGIADADPAPEGPVELLREALRRLPGDERALLSLKYLEGFELAEMARILGIPEGTVKSRLHHARGRLRDLVERMDR